MACYIVRTCLRDLGAGATTALPDRALLEQEPQACDPDCTSSSSAEVKVRSSMLDGRGLPEEKRLTESDSVDVTASTTPY